MRPPKRKRGRQGQPLSVVGGRGVQMGMGMGMFVSKPIHSFRFSDRLLPY